MKYRTIVVDPPWDYGRDAIRWPSGKPVHHNRIPYPAMSVEEIEALPILGMSERDAWLWLWATNKYLPSSFAVLEAWGFSYRQTLVWHKTGNPSPFGGTVAPNHAEFLLLAIRGHPSSKARLTTTVVQANKPTKHSQKPEIFLDYIESVCPGPYLELFARRNRFGWDTHGNECLNMVDLGTTDG